MSEQSVWILYRNHRGLVAWRHVKPKAFFFGDEPPWHPQPQWLVYAWDHDKGSGRTFALKDVLEWRTTPPGPDRKPTTAELVAEAKAVGDELRRRQATPGYDRYGCKIDEREGV